MSNEKMLKLTNNWIALFRQQQIQNVKINKTEQQLPIKHLNNNRHVTY